MTIEILSNDYCDCIVEVNLKLSNRLLRQEMLGGSTALYMASVGGHSEVIAWLLAKQARHMSTVSTFRRHRGVAACDVVDLGTYVIYVMSIFSGHSTAYFLKFTV